MWFDHVVNILDMSCGEMGKSPLCDVLPFKIDNENYVNENAESPLVITSSVSLSVRLSKFVQNYFRYDTLTQIVFILQLSNFVQKYFKQEEETYIFWDHIILSVDMFSCASYNCTTIYNTMLFIKYFRKFSFF